MLQGGALVNKDIPPFVKAAREPIAYAGINSIGLRRRGFTSEQIRDIQEIYRYLYLSGLNNSDAIERIEAELPATPERDEIIMFVRNAKRGIIRGYVISLRRFCFGNSSATLFSLLRLCARIGIDCVFGRYQTRQEQEA